LTPEELARRITPEAWARHKHDIMQRVVLTALRHSQMRTPVKTGDLHRSETTRVESTGERGYLGTNVTYAPYVHYGTKYMAARPFFEEGIEDSRQEILKILQDAGSAYFDEVAS
jgi:hypothetical protein